MVWNQPFANNQIASLLFSSFLWKHIFPLLTKTTMVTVIIFGVTFCSYDLSTSFNLTRIVYSLEISGSILWTNHLCSSIIILLQFFFPLDPPFCNFIHYLWYNFFWISVLIVILKLIIMQIIVIRLRR